MWRGLSRDRGVADAHACFTDIGMRGVVQRQRVGMTIFRDSLKGGTSPNPRSTNNTNIFNNLEQVVVSVILGQIVSFLR